MARLPTDAEVDNYITQVATRLGINPRVAVDVSRAERQQSWVGDNGSSFGPFQLHMGGLASGGNSGKGLGDTFREKTGLDPRDFTNNWRQQVDFSLQWAKTVSGWEPFHAAQNLGYGIWDGIRSAVGNTVASLQYYFPLQGYTADPHNTYHTPGATDLFAPLGTPIRDIADGRVETASTTGPGGNSVIIKGLDGLDYYYAHLQEPADVKPGDYVAAGQVIGKVGNTGNAADKAPHLHLGIGYGIQSGTGAAGGTGRNFDAQTFLANILSGGGASADPSGVVTGGAAAVSAFDIGGQIRQGLQGFGSDILQGIQNGIKDRAASIVLLTLGILFVIGGIWSMVSDSGVGRSIVKTVASTAGGPAGAVATAGV